MKTLIRLFGLVVMLDGVLSAALGRAFLSRLRAVFPRQLHPILDAFEQVPGPLFRAGALLQAAAGAHLLAHGSVLPRSMQARPPRASG